MRISGKLSWDEMRKLILITDMILSKLHQKYYGHFDEYQKSMGASFVTMDYCMKLLEKIPYDSILDARSGFSSLAFHSAHDNVTTIDDNPDWTERTQEILKDKTLDEFGRYGALLIKDRKINRWF